MKYVLVVYVCMCECIMDGQEEIKPMDFNGQKKKHLQLDAVAQVVEQS